MVLSNQQPEDMTPVEMEDGIHYYDPVTEIEDESLFTPWSDSDDEEDDETEEEPDDQSEESEENEPEDENLENPEEPEEPGGPEIPKDTEEAGAEGLGEGAVEEAGEATGEVAAEAGAEAGAEALATEGAVAGGSVLWWAIVALLIILGICLLIWFFFIIYSAVNPNSSSSSSVGMCSTLKSANPASSAGFVQLPKSKNYQGGGGSAQWGTPEMVAIIDTVLAKWNELHPDAKVYVGDLSLKNGGDISGHVSHEKGVDVDLSSSVCPSFTMSDGCYKKELALELAKLLFDTKAIKYIGYDDSWVINETAKYTKTNKLTGIMTPWANHANHFHVRIKDGLYTKACAQ